MRQTEFRRIGMHTITRGIPADEQEMIDYIARHGLQPAFTHLFRIAEKLGKGYPTVVQGRNVTILIHDLGEQSLQIPKLPAFTEPSKAVKHFAEAANSSKSSRPKTKSQTTVKPRQRGGWATRKAVDAMIEANPKLTRSMALAMYRNENPRSRAKNLTGPRKFATQGQRSWDQRVRNILEQAAEDGQQLTWQEAHELALNTFQQQPVVGTRQAA